MNEDSGQNIDSLGRLPHLPILSPGDSIIQTLQGHGNDSTVTIQRMLSTAPATQEALY